MRAGSLDDAHEMISLRGVRRGYDLGASPTPVLDGIDLEVAEGELLALVGRSGSGKTTLLNIIGGIDTGYEGKVVVHGRELGGLTDVELSTYRNRIAGFVFQAFHLLDHVTCLDNVVLPALFARPPAELTGPDMRRRALEILARVGLGHRWGARAAQLSGGERQRVALARALFHRPSILLCDELTGNLDDDTANMVVEILQEACDHDGSTVVVVTHDASVMNKADRVLQLEHGRLCERDPDRPGGTEKL